MVRPSLLTETNFSWICLFGSIPLAAQGFYLLRKLGNARERVESPENFTFENTTNLVEDGIYHYIRHPLYGSLLLLAIAPCSSIYRL